MIIVGGGLSGLSLGYYLKKKGVDFLLLEREERYGGVIKSFSNEKQIWDRAAVSFSMTPEIQEMISSLSLQEELVQAAQASNTRFIYRRGKLRKLTSSPASIFTSPLLSWRAKLRLLKETKVKSLSPEGESVAEFVSRRFGKELYESVANPVLSGIYAGNPEKMEAATVLKQFLAYEKEHGSVIKGFKANKGKNKRVISSFKKGTGTLTDELYQDIKDNCVSGVSIKSITKEEDGSFTCIADSGRAYSAQHIVACVPSFAAAGFIQELDESLAQKFVSIPYYPLHMSHLTYKKNQVNKSIEGFGFLFPEVEKKPLLGAVINSAAFDNRAGEDEITFTVFSRPDKGHTPEKARAFIEDLLQIKDEPIYNHLTDWQRAIPQFEIGFSELLKKIEAFEQKHNINLSGNFRSGVSVGDCVKYAKVLADKLA